MRLAFRATKVPLGGTRHVGQPRKWMVLLSNLNLDVVYRRQEVLQLVEAEVEQVQLEVDFSFD